MNHKRNNVLSLAVVIFLFLIALPVHAANSGYKVGVINIQKIISLSKVGQEAGNALKAKYDEYQTKLKKEDESLMEMKDEIEKKGAVWSEERRVEKQREFERRVKALEDETKYASNDMKEFERKTFDPILKELESIIASYGKEQGFSMIMDGRSGVVFMDESLDISAAIAAELDKKKGGEKK